MMNPNMAQYRPPNLPPNMPPNMVQNMGPRPLTSGGFAPKRGPMPPSAPNAQQTANQRQQQPSYAEIHQMATQRAKKPTDKNLPEGIDDVTIGNGVNEYRQMREFERKLDAIMMRKMMELYEKKAPTSERRRKLRLWISNTAEHQAWQTSAFEDPNTFDFQPSGEAGYRVKITGKLLEEPSTNENIDKDTMEHDIANEVASKGKRASPAQPKMSHFFKSIKMEVERPKGLQPEQAILVDWKKPNVGNVLTLPASADFDTLQFEKKSDENLQCTIILTRDEHPPRFKLSEPMSNVLGRDEASREEIISGIWEYAKAMELQQDEDKRMIQCDSNLKAVFHMDIFRFPDLGQLINEHILELPPIKLPYTVRVDAEYHNNPTSTVYDILVLGPDLLNAKKQAIAQNPLYAEDLRKLVEKDDQLAALIQSISDSKARYTFFNEMSKEPALFIRKWIASQKRDMEFIMGDSRYGSGDEWMAPEFRRGGKDGVWGTQNVRESVGLMVSTRK